MPNKTLELTDPAGGVVGSLDLDSLMAEIEARKPTPKGDVVVSDPGVNPKVSDAGGMLAGITNFEVASFPIGALAVGGSIAVLAAELVDGFLPNLNIQMRGAVKIGTAVAAGIWGKRLLGAKGSLILAALLGFDGLRDIVPLDLQIGKVANKITGTITTKGLIQGANRNESPVLTQANQIVASTENYYQRTRRGG